MLDSFKISCIFPYIRNLIERFMGTSVSLLLQRNRSIGILNEKTEIAILKEILVVVKIYALSFELMYATLPWNPIQLDDISIKKISV